MIYFVGDSFAPVHLKAAAKARGLPLTEYPGSANLVFISQDTSTDSEGNRDLDYIRYLIGETQAQAWKEAILVLTSQVPPGFTRSLNIPIYHMAETLRVTQDGMERALNPEQIILGCREPDKPLPSPLKLYCDAFNCPVWQVSYETAEASKICINLRLAHMVDSTNELSAYCTATGADWSAVADILRHDKRIGQYSYLEPGRWQESKHLLRDWKSYRDQLA